MFRMEAAYINTGHPEYLEAMKIVNQELSQASKSIKVDVQSPDGNEGGLFCWFMPKMKRKHAEMESPPPVLKIPETPSKRETLQVERTSTWVSLAIHAELLEKQISSYFNIVKRNMSDMVPKAVMLNLVNYAKEGLRGELFENFSQNNIAIDDLLKENDVLNFKASLLT